MSFWKIILGWIPNFVSGSLGFLIAVHFLPGIQEKYLQQNTFFHDKQQFFKTYTRDFSNWRISVWNLGHYICKIPNSSERRKAIQEQERKIIANYTQLIENGYNLRLYFGKRLGYKYVALLQWYPKQTINCSTAIKIAKTMLIRQREIVNPMSPEVYGYHANEFYKQ